MLPTARNLFCPYAYAYLLNLSSSRPSAALRDSKTFNKDLIGPRFSYTVDLCRRFGINKTFVLFLSKIYMILKQEKWSVIIDDNRMKGDIRGICHK